MSGKVVGWIGTHGPHPDHLDRHGERYGARARGLRMVLLAVGDAANPDGEHAHPGIENVADFALYSKRQTINLLQELEAEGWISVEEKGGGLGRATVYSVTMTARQKGEVVAQNGSGNCAMADAETVQPALETVQPRVHSNGKQRRDLSNETSSPSSTTTRDGFERFWQAYPKARRIAKPEALKAFVDAVKTVDAEIIIAGAERYCADPNRLDQFTPYPQKWLKQQRWNAPPEVRRVGRDQRPQADIVNAAAAKVAERQAAGAPSLFALPGGQR